MKVKLWYSIDDYAEKFDRVEQKYEAQLSFYWVEGDNNSYESIMARGATFEEAREKVIALFKSLPPTEELYL